MARLHDAHIHLDFAANAEKVAQRAAAESMLFFANTVVPDAYGRTSQAFAQFENVFVGWGFHPWWVGGTPDIGKSDGQQPRDIPPTPASPNNSSADGGGSADGGSSANGGSSADGGSSASGGALDEQQLHDLRKARFVGEVGLDFSVRHASSKSEQLALFSEIAETCTESGGKILSVHAVKAARETLDVLENAGTLSECTCIFHWFSGPSDQLKRAIDAKCLFSIGPRMIVTKKGREYVKAIPAHQLLLETDLPERQGDTLSYEQMRDALTNVCDFIATIKGRQAIQSIEETAERIFQR